MVVRIMNNDPSDDKSLKDDTKAYDQVLDEEEIEPSFAKATKGKETEGDIEKLKEEVKDLEEKWKRAIADYQNLERRYQEGKRELILSANKDLILKMLPVLDTLILASDHLKDEGLRLSIQKFLDVLKDEGIEEIKTENEKFDPNTMEGVGTLEGSKDKVVEEVRKGYALNGKVLRPAQVKVGK